MTAPIADSGDGTATGMQGNRHIRYHQPTPLAICASLLDRVGVRLDAFADSDGKLEELFPLSV